MTLPENSGQTIVKGNSDPKGKETKHDKRTNNCI